MSEDQEREKFASDADADVEAHKLSSRMSEADEKRDKIAETDDADVEGHMLKPKLSEKMN